MQYHEKSINEMYIASPLCISRNVGYRVLVFHEEGFQRPVPPPRNDKNTKYFLTLSFFGRSGIVVTCVRPSVCLSACLSVLVIFPQNVSARARLTMLLLVDAACWWQIVQPVDWIIMIVDGIYYSWKHIVTFHQRHGRLKSPTTQLVVRRRMQTNNESTGDRWIPLTNGQ